MRQIASGDEITGRYLATIRASGELQTLLERFLPFYSSSAYSPRQ